MVDFIFAATAYSNSNFTPGSAWASECSLMVPPVREMHTPQHPTFGYILNIQIKLNLDKNQRSSRLLVTRINVAFDSF